MLLLPGIRSGGWGNGARQKSGRGHPGRDRQQWPPPCAVAAPPPAANSHGRRLAPAARCPGRAARRPAVGVQRRRAGSPPLGDPWQSGERARGLVKPLPVSPQIGRRHTIGATTSNRTYKKRRNPHPPPWPTCRPALTPARHGNRWSHTHSIKTGNHTTGAVTTGRRREWGKGGEVSTSPAAPHSPHTRCSVVSPEKGKERLKKNKGRHMGFRTGSMARAVHRETAAPRSVRERRRPRDTGSRDSRAGSPNRHGAPKRSLPLAAPLLSVGRHRIPTATPTTTPTTRAPIVQEEPLHKRRRGTPPAATREERRRVLRATPAREGCARGSVA